jgi:hypothetical protein
MVIFPLRLMLYTPQQQIQLTSNQLQFRLRSCIQNKHLQLLCRQPYPLLKLYINTTVNVPVEHIASLPFQVLHTTLPSAQTPQFLLKIYILQ